MTGSARAAAGLDAPIPAVAEDGALYPIGKLRAHELGALHLAISVFVFDEDGALLLQRRAPGKYHCGGQWANTCCTHPHWGETAAACAARRLREELGVCVPLAARGVTDYRAEVGGGLVEHERVTLFVGRVLRDGLRLRPNPEEVMATRWVALAELRREAAERPERFTPWLRIYLSRFPDLLF